MKKMMLTLVLLPVFISASDDVDVHKRRLEIERSVLPLMNATVAAIDTNIMLEVFSKLPQEGTLHVVTSDASQEHVFALYRKCSDWGLLKGSVVKLEEAQVEVEQYFDGGSVTALFEDNNAVKQLALLASADEELKAFLTDKRFNHAKSTPMPSDAQELRLVYIKK